MARSEGAQSLIGKGRGFLSECSDELRKVVKPTRQETIQATLVTIFIMVFVAAALWLFDVVFSQLMMAVLS